MTNRLFVSLEKDPDRLANLTGLQSRMLSHAMRAFTKAKKIVYSTCSIHHEENEKVVQECLEMCPDWKLIKPLEFAEQWKHFGSPKFKHIGKKCLYAKSEIDLTDGFFVAIFERDVDLTKSIEPYSRNEAVLERINFNLKRKYTTETTADIESKKVIDEPTVDLTIGEDVNVTEHVKKKKKKPKDNDCAPDDVIEKTVEPFQEMADPEINSTKKSKKSKKSCSDLEVVVAEGESEKIDVGKIKKEKRKVVDEVSEPSTTAIVDESIDFGEEKAKKKKKKKHDNGSTETGLIEKLDETVDLTSNVTNIVVADTDSIKAKKKKSKNK